MMDGPKNPFDQFDTHTQGVPAGLPAGAIMVAPPAPGYGNLQPKSDEELRQIRLANQKSSAQAPYDAQQAADDATIKHAQAVKAAQDVSDAAAARQAAQMSATGNVHGPDYFNRYVPAQAQPIVRSILEGNLPVGARSLTSPQMLPYLRYALNVDPTFSAADYPTRAAFRQGLAQGKEGISIDALNTAMAHAHTIAGTLGTLNNQSGVIGTSIKNPVGNWLSERQGSQTVPVLRSQLTKYGDEKNRVYVGGNGGEAERAQAQAELPVNGSPEQQFGVLRSDVEFYKGKLQALDAKGKRILGPTFSIYDTLSPEARASIQYFDGLDPKGIKADGTHPGDLPPSVSAVPARTGPGSSRGSGGGGGSGGPGVGPGGDFTPPGPAVGMSLATGATRTVDNTKANAIIDSMIRAGASDEQISAAIQPLGFGAVDPRQTSASRAYLKAHPGYQGSFGGAQAQVPTTAWNRFAASPVGTGIFGAADASVGGLTDEFASMVGGGDLADLNARKQAAFAANPKSAFIGQAAGTIGSMYGLGALGRATGLASRVPQLAGDIAFGAASGAGQDNDNRVLGAALGAAGGLGGHYLGQGIASGVGAVGRTAPGRVVTGMFGRGAAAPATPLTSGEQAVFSAAHRAGLPNVRASLTEAGQLGVPMTLADTTTGLRSLAGAAVRRSPAAAQMAENVLIPRARGQVDRFGNAVTRDLGPTANIPQQSEALTQQARAAAAPLYDQAYAQSVPHTPEFDAVLNTPFGQQALARARTIAANERRIPQELGFALDANGNTVLNPHPSQQIADHMSARAALDDAQAAYRTARTTPGADMTAAANRVEAARQQMRTAQSALDAAPDPTHAASVPAHTQQTLDYVKRGMDDVLEEQRNKITGRLDLDEAGRAQNQVRGQLLTENDRLNPAFAQARAAYAGPAQARDALFRGQDAYRLSPDELQMQVGAQSPEHLDQMRLGDRSQLVENARSLRDATNPFEAASTLGSPAARARLSLLHGGAPDTNVDRLLRQADIERSLARTNNKVLGNSDTAERTLADKAFGYASWAVPAAMDMGLMAMGHVPVATAARLAATGGVRDAFTMGLGRRAVAKADELAPMLLNSNPAAGVSALDGLATKDQLWREYIARTTPKRVGGMFGRGIGSQALVAPLTYGTP